MPVTRSSKSTKASTNPDHEEIKRAINGLTIKQLLAVLDKISLTANEKASLSCLRHICLQQLDKNYISIKNKILNIQLSLNLPRNRNMYQQNNMGMIVGQGNGTLTGNVAHSNGIVPQYNLQQNTANYQINPEVKLKKLAFFDVMATLLKPSTLVPINNQRVQEGTYYFHLSPQQATDIASNRDMRNSSKLEHVIQVQLRFCLLETTSEQEDYFPPNIIVKVNNKVCALPTPIPTNKPNAEAKRPPRPVNITTHVKLSPTVANQISVSWCTDLTRGYVISAYLVKKLTSQQLLSRMKTKLTPSDFTRDIIIEKLKEDADCEIATTMLKVSLVCPLGKMRMTTPCRSSTCSHLQCFDASTYLLMNERKPTWNCPVCDKPGIYENLVIDGYFQEVLASSKLSSDTNEIQLNKDGSWSTHVQKNESENLDTPASSSQNVEIISDDLEMITDAPKTLLSKQFKVAQSRILNEPSSTTAAPAASTNAVNISSVDLTLSDSDDDVPLKPRNPQPKSVQNNGGTSSTNTTTETSNNNSTTTTANNRAVTPTSQTPSTAPSATANTNDISIISLDSPSPPSSPVTAPVEPIFVGTPASSYGSSNFIASTSQQFSHLLSNTDTHANNMTNSNSASAAASSNYRYDGQHPQSDPLDTSQMSPLAYQRLMQMQQQQKNWNIVQPYRHDDQRQY